MNDKQAGMDLPKIIKRLELIKTLILLEEEYGIPEQIKKLQQLTITIEVNEIIIELNQKSFGKAVSRIEVFNNSYKQLSLFIEPEIAALHFEAKSLEAHLQQLSAEKTELEKLLHEFSVRHSQELGELILKILQIRKLKSKGTIKEAEAEKDYEDFNSNYLDTKDKRIVLLNEDEQKELKDYYRKASKLCHPDVVDEAQKETAHQIFIELNTAYECNDLERVKEIFANLQQRKTFTSKSDTANEKLMLQTEIKRLRILIKELIAIIDGIKESDTYNTIMSIRNWDEYFSQTKQQLKEQLNQLKDGGI